MEKEVREEKKEGKGKRGFKKGKGEKQAESEGKEKQRR